MTDRTSVFKNDKPIALLISLFFPPERGGGSTGAWNRALVLKKMGYSVRVISGLPVFFNNEASQSYGKSKNVIFKERLDSFDVIRLKTLPLKYEGIVKRLIIFLNFSLLCLLLLPLILQNTGRIDLVYARSPVIFSSFVGFMYSLSNRSFFIYEAPDLWPEELITVRSSLVPLIMRFGRIFAKISYRMPDMLVTIGERAAKYISQQYMSGKNVYGIPVGVDISKYSFQGKQTSRRELTENGILPITLLSKFIILYSGLISSAQNIENLALAAQELADESEVSIVVIGEGPEKLKMIEMKRHLNLENLYLFPSQPREVISKIISAADVCSVLLSPDPIFDIAVPTKFYEYLACRKPILGVCRGELADIITKNKIGLVADPLDLRTIVAAIRRFKNMPNVVQEMETNCISAINKFTIDTISSDFKNIIKHQTNKRGKKSGNVRIPNID